MIGLRIVPLAGAPPQAWRNGGGVTRELLAWPQAAAWALRVSVAQVDGDGPFSPFPGVERWFAVVHGAGVALALDGRVHELTPTSPPLHFDGAAAPRCRLLDGAAVDLNLMLRRDAGHGSMLRAHAAAAWRSPASWRALYAAGPASLQIDGRHAAELAAAALVWHPHAAAQEWTFRPAEESVPGWFMGFQPKESAPQRLP